MNHLLGPNGLDESFDSKSSAAFGPMCSPIWTSSVRRRMTNGTLGYNLSASLTQHSRYLSSVTSCGVHGRSESPKMASTSSNSFCCSSGCLEMHWRNQVMDEAVVSWPWFMKFTTNQIACCHPIKWIKKNLTANMTASTSSRMSSSVKSAPLAAAVSNRSRNASRSPVPKIETVHLGFNGMNESNADWTLVDPRRRFGRTRRSELGVGRESRGWWRRATSGCSAGFHGPSRSTRRAGCWWATDEHRVPLRSARSCFIQNSFHSKFTWDG